MYIYVFINLNWNLENSEAINVFYAFVIGTLALLTLAISVVVFFSIYRKRLAEQQLSIEKKESEHRLELLKSNIEVAEAERRRIARDLHDEIGSQLTAIRMMMNNIRNSNDISGEVDRTAEASKIMLDETLQSVRSISHNLLPPGLEKFGFFNTLEDFCNYLMDTGQLSIETQIDGEIQFMPKETELALYRVLQELFSNGIRHGKANEIKLKFEFSSTNLLLFYNDNGIGTDMKNINNKSGLGLKNIEGRITAVGGQVEFQSKETIGFEAKINIPLSDE
jgi:signal transduction histidine kinase